MGVLFYNIFLVLYRSGLHVAALFHGKARKWVDGRKNIFERLQAAIPADARVIWVHCASLGEFEQGRPVIDGLRSAYPGYKILLTFFSPSGYEVRKDYDGADWVFYLPLDGAKTARRFLEIVHPSLVIFVKYEFWYYYLKKIKYRDIPLLLISALFREDMSFFRWYGGVQRKILSRFDHLFVQNIGSKKLIDGIGLGQICSVSGDTRFDRVVEIAGKAGPIPLIAEFTYNKKTIVAGSTWPEDEEALQQAMTKSGITGLKLIIAPHEIDDKHLEAIEKLFPSSVRYSKLNEGNDSDCLIIDNIGMLSRLYQYADIAYIGGGLKSAGIHNVLEAAVYGKPVLFGPFYKKYSEAIGLVDSGGAISFRDFDKLVQILQSLLTDEIDHERRSKAAMEYVKMNQGATGRIMWFIQEKRLLTS